MLELHKRVSTVACARFGGDYELILVDDGSKDHTWDIICRLSDEDPHVVGVKLARNHGHQLALTSGLSVVRGELVFVIDGDLQDPPELLSEMYEMMLQEGADVVYGQRRTRAGESKFKRKSADAFYRLLARMTTVDIPVDTGDFRLMTRRISDHIAQMPEHDRFIRGLVSWLGYKQVAFKYDREPRFAGTTKYPLRKMISFATDAIVSFSVLPLRLATLTGALLTCAMFLIGIYAFLGWLFSGTAPGWTSLTLLIVFVSAVQFMVLGVIGEYVGRIYIQSKQRPLFLISEIRQVPAKASEHPDAIAAE
jgi:dolichol-phosphate mannosyltransferase